MASDLKPCPFCGGEPTLNDPGGSQLADCYDIAIRCRDCDAEVSGLVDQDYCDDGGAEVRGEVVAAWNRRAPADLSAAEAAAAREAVERCADYVAECFAELGLPLGVESIRALAAPPPGALDRVRQAARAEGMEDAAVIAAAETKAPGQRNSKDQWVEQIGARIAAAIRAAKDQPA